MRVICASCKTRYNDDEDGSCPRCGNTDIVDENQTEGPGEVKATIIDVPDSPVISPYEKEQRQKKRIGISCSTIFAFLLLLILFRGIYNYLDNKVHREEATVIGFSWKSEIDVKPSHGEVKTVGLIGSGKTFSWPGVTYEIGQKTVEMRSYYYVHLASPEGKEFEPFEVPQPMWEILNFNNRVTVEVNALGNIKTISSK